MFLCFSSRVFQDFLFFSSRVFQECFCVFPLGYFKSVVFCCQGSLHFEKKQGFSMRKALLLMGVGCFS